MSGEPVADRTDGPPERAGSDDRRVSSERRSTTRRRTIADVTFARNRRRLADRRVWLRRIQDGRFGGLRQSPRQATTQAENNARMWTSRRLVASYAHASLEPAEALTLARYREALTGRVLDVGCGAGRVLGYLVMLGADAHGVDISADMVEHCRRMFPTADVRLGDLSDLPAAVEGTFDAILLPDNLIDIYGDAQRRAVLTGLHALLSAGGLLVFSSHNLAAWERPGRQVASDPKARAVRIARALATTTAGSVARRVQHAPRVWVNRRRLGPLQQREDDHAIVNDAAHEYGLLHYYIGRDGQERQLSELGFRLLDVLDLAGPSVPPGEDGQGPSLYYVATPAT
jgi:SAM-dependent methyltransferase